MTLVEVEESVRLSWIDTTELRFRNGEKICQVSLWCAFAKIPICIFYSQEGAYCFSLCTDS